MLALLLSVSVRLALLGYGYVPFGQLARASGGY